MFSIFKSLSKSSALHKTTKGSEEEIPDFQNWLPEKFCKVKFHWMTTFPNSHKFNLCCQSHSTFLIFKLFIHKQRQLDFKHPKTTFRINILHLAHLPHILFWRAVFLFGFVLMQSYDGWGRGGAQRANFIQLLLFWVLKQANTWLCLTAVVLPLLFFWLFFGI